MKTGFIFIALVCAAASRVPAQTSADMQAGHHHGSHGMMSTYIGDERREIKSLSQSDVDGLLNGEGLGMARAAELNHYPGPRHVLDAGEQLGITPDQRKAIEGSFDRMREEAVRLGGLIVERERTLDSSFVSGTATPESVRGLTREIAELSGRLRSVHLTAHIEVRAALTPRQIESYDRLRGYAGHN